MRPFCQLNFWAGLLLLGLMTGCQQATVRQQSAAAATAEVQQIAVGPVLLYTERLASRLFTGLPPLTKGAIAVVSFTEVQGLQPDPQNVPLNMLGLQLQESMIAIASQRGYQVKELRLSKEVSFYADHERMLSRDLTQLANEQAVRYVIVGTLNQIQAYTTVNARLVDIQNNTVVAAVSDLIPAAAMGAEEQLQWRQQKLHRHSSPQ